MSPSDKIRAFIAVDLDEQAKTFLKELITDLRSAGGQVKWVRPEGIHLTLKFLGNVDADLIPDLDQTLRPLFAAEAPFRLNIESTGAFPSTGKPNVIWTGLKDSTKALQPLVAAVEKSMEQMGFPAERRPFKAHLTIGRSKSRKRDPDLTEAILNHRNLTGPEFLADHATLYQSVLKPSGAEYTSLRRFDFLGK